jgi:DNA helicase HerA-like ATPase
VGRVTSVSGAQASVTLNQAPPQSPDGEQATVGKFVGIVSGGAIIIGVVSEINEFPGHDGDRMRRSVARLELLGEISARDGNAAHFKRGLDSYPKIGDSAILMTEAELRIVYGTVDNDRAHVGDLQQNPNIGVHINIDELVSRHFAVIGTTGVGKSSGVVILLQKILSTRPNLRIFLVDPHNEFGKCFGDKAVVLSPHNVRLPFWLFNFEESVDAFLGGRAASDEELEILAEIIPLAKAAYLQYRANDRQAVKRREGKNGGFTADTPVPYRIEDLLVLLDERMGKLENRSTRAVYHKLISRIQTLRNHPRYSFMFENANLGGDTMPDVLSQLFRLPPDGKPITIMQLAGFPAEVIDSVVSVLSRMAFDFGLWSDGAAPLLFVCEEAHRYAPADAKAGFGPTRRALSRIAREGRKYGVYLGLITQRPSEIDPTIISQCSTLFVMRLSNDRDQAFINSAVCDASGNLLSFIPSLGTREVFTFGSGIAVPTRMRFRELPAAMRPLSEATGNTRSNASVGMHRDLITSVIERWRGASVGASVGARSFSEAERLEPEPPLPESNSNWATATQDSQPPAFTDANRQELLRRAFRGSNPASASPARPRLGVPPDNR